MTAHTSSTTSKPKQEDTQMSLMPAVVYEKYGSFDLLRLRDIPKPVIKDNEVLVRVEATGLHVGDCFGVRGAPFIMRLYTGLFKPKYGVPGFDFAGRVERVGKEVKRFQPGDEVFGASSGTCAGFARAKESELALKPTNSTYEEAAAVPTSALAALHALRDAGNLQAGQKVLINGASGGVGTFAVQIAKAMGAEVTGVCSKRNIEMVRSIGADHVIDYTSEDFTRNGQHYDLILDNVENRSLSDIRRALSATGTLLLNSGTGAKGFGLMVRLFKPLLLSPFVGQNLRRFFSEPNHEDLVVLKNYIEKNQLAPVIDKTYPLEETAAALEYIEKGHARGKIVITQ